MRDPSAASSLRMTNPNCHSERSEESCLENFFLAESTYSNISLSSSIIIIMADNHKTYYVYIMASTTRTLYVGFTGNLFERVLQHKKKEIPGFTQKYNIDKLVYYEETNFVNEAILREKQIKGWLRHKKIALIESLNVDWLDLSRDWYKE